MTFFHCINCIILTYAPFFVYYKAARLDRDRHLGLIFKSLAGFCLSSIIKMAAAATFAGSDVESQLSFVNELLYSITYLIDAMYIAYLIDSNKFEIKSRMENIALGWAAGEAIMGKFLPLLIYSRSPEVDYKWIQSSLDTSFDLVFTISFVFAIWLALCTTGKLTATVSELIFLGIHVIVPGLLSYLKNADILNNWIYILVHATISCALYCMGKSIYKRKVDSKRD